MNYNRGRVMKRAWELKREKNITIGQAIKMSWSIEKESSTPVKKQNDFRKAVKSLFGIDLEYNTRSNKNESVEEVVEASTEENVVSEEVKVSTKNTLSKVLIEVLKAKKEELQHKKEVFIMLKEKQQELQNKKEVFKMLREKQREIQHEKELTQKEIDKQKYTHENFELFFANPLVTKGKIKINKKERGIV